MRFARRVADYRVHPPRCPHACRTATACVPQPTQCPRQQRASEPHTPQAVADVGLHMARHMKAASCRLLRSHAAVDGTPRRLMVPHTPPRPPWAAPRRREEAVRTTCCATNVIAGLREMSLHNAGFAPTGGRRIGCWLTPPCPCPHTAPARLAHASPVPPPAWQVLHETPSVLRADDEGQNHLDVTRGDAAERGGGGRGDGRIDVGRRGAGEAEEEAEAGGGQKDGRREDAGAGGKGRVSRRRHRGRLLAPCLWHVSRKMTLSVRRAVMASSSATPTS